MSDIQTTELEGDIEADAELDGEVNMSTGVSDYKPLTSKPTINGIELIGDKLGIDYNLATILTNSTAQWDADTTLISKKDTIYIYTDKYTRNDKVCPGFKLGDGTSYLIDLPFIDYATGITEEERTNWNNKVTCYMDESNPDTIIFTKEVN